MRCQSEEAEDGGQGPQAGKKSEQNIQQITGNTDPLYPMGVNCAEPGGTAEQFCSVIWLIYWVTPKSQALFQMIRTEQPTKNKNLQAHGTF